MTDRRVLIITTAFPPSTCAGIHRILRFARYLPEQGWHACVLSEGKFDGLPADLAARFDLPDGFLVVRTPALGRKYDLPIRDQGQQTAVDVQDAASSIAAKPRFVRSFARNLRDLVTTTPDRDIAWTVTSLRKAIRMVRDVRPDVMLTSGPPHSTHLIGLVVKRLTGTPWVADFRDPWARRPWGRKPQNPWGQHLLGRIERRCVRHADRIILNTEPMTAEFQSFYSEYDAARFVTIPNACDPRTTDHVRHLRQMAVKQRQHRDSPSLRLCHPGSLYRKRDPRPLLKAIRRLRHEGVRVAFEQIGACDREFSLEQFVVENQLQDAVTVLPPIPHSECLERMAAADAFVLIQPGTETQIPGKLFEMISFERPIIALADDGATADVVREYGVGVVARPDDENLIATAIRAVIDQSPTMTTSDRWKDIREDYGVDRTVKRLADALDEVIGCRSRSERDSLHEAALPCR